MAITYPLSVPTTIGLASVEFRAINAVATSQSPFTYKQQVFVHPGQRWELSASIPPCKRDLAEDWVGFLMSLKGNQGTFLIGDVNSTTARGSAGGTPLVKGGTQTGGTLLIDGATVSQTGWLKAGDYIQLGTGLGARLHKVLQDADSDGSGDVTLEIWPDLRASPADNATILIANTVGLFRLKSNTQSWRINDISSYGIQFEAIEVIA